MRIHVVIPAYNERERLAGLVPRTVAAAPGPVWVVDDGSTDGSGDAAAALGARRIRRPVRGGVGAAIRDGYRAALDAGAEIVVVMAGNGKDDPREIPRLTGPIERDKADIVQGSRYRRGGRSVRTPFHRRLGTGLIHPLLLSLICRRRFTDSTNGFRAINARILRDPRMRLDRSWLDRYELEPYLLLRAVRLGYRVIEAPVSKIYPARGEAYTKMTAGPGWWSILRPLVFAGIGWPVGSSNNGRHQRSLS